MLDVYPTTGPESAPVLFFVHGGGWSSGNKSLYEYLGHHFSRNGFCTVIINHRLSPEVKHPEHASDAAKAFSWVHEHIENYGGDPERISLMGHSSGAHITALLCSDPSYLNELGRSPNEVKRYVGLSGVYKIDLMITLSGYHHVFNMEDTTRASPAHYVPACPCLLAYGEYDYMTMPRQTMAFADQIEAHGDHVEVVLADDEDHDSIVLNVCDLSQPYARSVLDFLRE